jgi:hypothetical protein
MDASPSPTERDLLGIGRSLPNIINPTVTGTFSSSYTRKKTPQDAKPYQDLINSQNEARAGLSSPAKKLTLKVGMPAVSSKPIHVPFHLAKRVAGPSADSPSLLKNDPPRRKLILFTSTSKRSPPKQNKPVVSKGSFSGSFEDPFDKGFYNAEKNTLIDSSQKPFLKNRPENDKNFIDSSQPMNSIKKGDQNMNIRGNENLLQLSFHDSSVSLENDIPQVPINLKHPVEEPPYSKTKISHLFSGMGPIVRPDNNQKVLRRGQEPSAEKSQQGVCVEKKQQSIRSVANLDNMFQAMASFQAKAASGSKQHGPYGYRPEKSSISAMMEGSVPNLENRMKAERMSYLVSQDVFLKMFDRREKALQRWRKLKAVVKGSSLLRAVDSKEFIHKFEGSANPARIKHNLVIMPSSWIKFLIYLIKIIALVYNFFYIQIV